MKSSASIVAENRDGQTILADMRSEPPVSLRPTRRGVALVGSAAGPVGGDEISMTVEVGTDASLYLEAIAATMVFPSPTKASSLQDLRISVDEGGHLEWQGQPILPILGSVHVQRVTIELAATATLEFVDSVALGRSGQEPGLLDAEIRVVRGGQAVLHQRQIYDSTDPGWGTTASLGGFRHVRQHLVIGPAARVPEVVTSKSRMFMRTAVQPDVELTVIVSHDGLWDRLAASSSRSDRLHEG